MCKSENQPGGPYRCSGDKERAYYAAKDRLRDVMEDYGSAEGDARSAKERTAGFEKAAAAGNEHAADMLPQVRRDEEKAAAAYEKVRDRYDKALARVNAARADYDATPRGAARLQARLRDAHPDDRDWLQRRMDAGLAQMNEDAKARESRWGSTYGDRVAVPYWQQGDPTTPDRIHTQVNDPRGDQQITASGVDYGTAMDPDTGQEYRDYQVTFHTSFRDGPVGDDGYPTTRQVDAHVNVRVDAHSELPSQVAVMTKMRDRVVTARECGTVRDYCNTTGLDYDDPGQRGVGRRELQESRTWDRQGRQIFGVTWEKIVQDAKVGVG